MINTNYFVNTDFFSPDVNIRNKINNKQNSNHSQINIIAWIYINLILVERLVAYNLQKVIKIKKYQRPGFIKP